MLGGFVCGMGWFGQTCMIFSLELICLVCWNSFARPALLAYSFLSNQRTWLGLRGFALLGLLDFLFRINSCCLLGFALPCLAGFTFSSELTPSARVV